MAGSTAACSSMAASCSAASSRAGTLVGRPLPAAVQPPARRWTRRRLHVAATAAPSSRAASSSSDGQLEVAEYGGDAFADLVAMAVAADPSLPLPPAAAAACSSAGPSLDALPLSNKPPWLRQRAAQGERFEYLKGQMGGLKLATVRGGVAGWW